VTFRVISRLDIKPPNLVKGIHLEGLRKVGDPAQFATKYYKDGIDEISYQDIVASLYNQNSIKGLVSTTAESIFVPISVGGGIRSIDDATELIRSGADKISINTAAIKRPEFLKELADVLGNQAVILGVEAKKSVSGDYLAMTDCGREHTGKSVLDWIQEASYFGIGEILLTSIDAEGAQKGFDLELLSKVREITDVPVIAHGGCGKVSDVSDVKNHLSSVGIEVRG
jgi:cyclase